MQRRQRARSARIVLRRYHRPQQPVDMLGRVGVLHPPSSVRSGRAERRGEGKEAVGLEEPKVVLLGRVELRVVDAEGSSPRRPSHMFVRCSEANGDIRRRSSSTTSTRSSSSLPVVVVVVVVAVGSGVGGGGGCWSFLRRRRGVRTFFFLCEFVYFCFEADEVSMRREGGISVRPTRCCCCAAVW